MFTQTKSNEEKAFAIGSSSDPQDGQRTVANASRLVIRDKSPQDPPQKAKEIAFSTAPTEEATLQVGKNNTGRLVFNPIPNEFADVSVAHVDWLGVTLTLSEGKALAWLFEELKSVFELSITQVKNGGWNGYTNRAELGRYGIVAWGGKAQRGTAHIEINGMGCAQISNWLGIQNWGIENHAWITRIDLAHDDLDGAQCTIERTLQWYEHGGFNCGGRNAKVKLAGDWHDLTDGRTVYIGTRGNKMLRCYEKGKQLDDLASPWVRVELELRNKNRLLPWDMLTRPGQYLAGAYPCLAFLSTEQNKLKTTQKAAAISLDCMTDNAARLSGKAINVLMQLHKDADTVVDLLRRDGIPKRLSPYEDHLRSMANEDTEP